MSDLPMSKTFPGTGVPHAGARVLLFARHGATAPNLAGVRCGGDIDPPLADVGRAQAAQLALAVARLPSPPDLIVTSHLLRTRQTATIVMAALGAVELRSMAGFGERRLGQWNLQPIADTEVRLSRGDTPPGGESNAVFEARIQAALAELAPELHRRVLLIASKGVGRVLRQLAGLVPRAPLANAELVELSFDSLACPESSESSA
jgi:2,3-bisphosphoglycerate-dependent phosphoglycerate mutase